MSHQLQSDPQMRHTPFKSVFKDGWLHYSAEQKIKDEFSFVKGLKNPKTDPVCILGDCREVLEE